MKKLKKEELSDYFCSFCEKKNIPALFKTEFEARVYSCYKHQRNLVDWEKDYYVKKDRDGK